MDRRRLVMVLAGMGGFAVLALVFLLFLRPGDEPAQTLPPPAHTATTEDPGVEVEPLVRTSRLTGITARDPFTPVIEPSETAPTGQDEAKSSESSESSSDPQPAKGSKGSDGKAGSGKPDAPVSGQSGQASDEATPKADDSGPGSRAPVPIGGAAPTEDGQPVEQVQLSVVRVQDSAAVVRINGARMRLFLAVPDATGITYVSYLGGGCGWFTVTSAEERLSICAGQTRAL